MKIGVIDLALLFTTYLVIGLLIGSFLNVCIYRLPVGKSIIKPPSSCGTCGHRLGALDMVPVLSYLFLRGKCRYCHTPYSPRYALVELLTGILFMLCGLYYLPGIPLVLAFLFVACLVAITFIDFDHQIIMDEFLIILLVGGLLYVGLYTKDYWDALYGVLFSGGLMLLIYLVSRGGMGEGDVKLSFVLGLWLGLQHSMLCLLLAFIMGGVIGVILLATGLKSRKDPIPFGPYLCIGAYLSLLFGPYLIFYYWRLFA